MDTSQGGPQNKRGLRRRSHFTILRGHALLEDGNTSKPKPIIKAKDRMHIVDPGASLHMTEASSLSPQEKKTIRKTKCDLEIQTASGIVRSTTVQRLTSRSSALICTRSWWKIRFRCCLMDDCAMSWSIPTLGTQQETWH